MNICWMSGVQALGVVEGHKSSAARAALDLRHTASSKTNPAISLTSGR